MLANMITLRLSKEGPVLRGLEYVLERTKRMKTKMHSDGTMQELQQRIEIDGLQM